MLLINRFIFSSSFPLLFLFSFFIFVWAQLSPVHFLLLRISAGYSLFPNSIPKFQYAIQWIHTKKQKKKSKEHFIFMCGNLEAANKTTGSSFEHIAGALISESEKSPSNLQVPICLLIIKQILILTFIKFQKAIFLRIWNVFKTWSTWWWYGTHVIFHSTMLPFINKTYIYIYIYIYIYKYCNARVATRTKIVQSKSFPLSLLMKVPNDISPHFI